MIDQANPRELTIAVFGMGYVGTTCAAFFAGQGHRVYGVESDPAKSALLARGQVPFIEAGLEERFRDAITHRRVEMADDAEAAVARSHLSLVCVGTPTAENGRVQTGHIFTVARQIAHAITRTRRFHVLAIRSTCPPGTTDEVARLIAESTGLTADQDFAVLHNPEFLREGTALADMARPPFTVVGSRCERACELIRTLYHGVDAPFEVMTPPDSEMLKYASNVFHAMKVAFANEVGDLAEHFGADPQRIMEVFCRDRQLNISAKYLRPGFAFGGSCLPKDVRAMAGIGREAGMALPLAQNVIASNDAHFERACERILSIDDAAEVGILGLAFKPGSDDLRESPYVRLARRLLDAGRQVRICEPAYRADRLLGANRAYIMRMLPQIDDLCFEHPEEVVEGCPVIVLSRNDPPFMRAVNRLAPRQWMIDLSNRIERRGDAEPTVQLGPRWNKSLKHHAARAAV